MRIKSIPIPVIIIAGGTLLAVLFTLRGYAADLLAAKSAAAVREGRSIADIHRLTQRTARMAGSDARPYRFRGLASYGVAAEADEETRELWLAMASRDLVEALRRNPMDGVAFRALARTAHGLKLSSEALRFAEASVKRQPATPDNYWILARLHEPGSEAQTEAYAELTALRPLLTGSVLREVHTGAMGLDDLAPYIAKQGATYVEWANATTDPVLRGKIAERGVGYVEPDSPDSQRQYGWLYYYMGLGAMEENPGEAVLWLRKATAALPDTHAFQRNLGFALLRVGKVEAAREAFVHSTNLYSDLANAAHLGLAQADEELGNLDQALELYRRLADTPRMEEWVKTRARSGIRRIERSSP